MAQKKLFKELSSSLVGESEEAVELYCQPCGIEQQEEAAGYCQQCNEYLCETCCNYHGKFAAFKQHKLLDKASMPKANPPTKKQNQDALTEACKNHPDKILEYFCNTHSQICCTVCLKLYHHLCESISYIPDISSSTETRQECTANAMHLDRLVLDITKLLTTINSDVQASQQSRSNALADIKKSRKQVSELLDKIEENTRKQVSKLHQENVQITKVKTEQCQALLSDVKRLAADIGAFTKAGNNNKLFVKLKLSKGIVEEAKGKLRGIASRRIKQFTFEQTSNENSQQIETALSSMWSLSVRQGDAPSTARYARELNVKCDGEVDCGITGIAVLAGDRIVLTDWDNKAVKLIDMALNGTISCLTVSSEPCDVTELDTHQVAVALPNEEKIDVFTTSQLLTKMHTINTPEARVVGLCFDGSNFISACHHPSSIKIIDMSGTTLNTFSNQSFDSRVFMLPTRLAIGRNKNVIYVSDQVANTVTCMSTAGHVISVCAHDMLQCARGVDVDPNGAVYVCGGLNNTVSQLNPSLIYARTLLTQAQEMVWFPMALACSRDGDMLYISSASTASEDRNFIRLFELE